MPFWEGAVLVTEGSVEDELFLGAEDIEIMEDVWLDNKLRFERVYVGRTFRDRMPFFEVRENSRERRIPTIVEWW